MNAPALDGVPWRALLRHEAANWVFVLRTVLAMLLALAIAFRLDLSTPGSAAVTVSIIALPQAGMVLEKSFYRLVGTLTGAVVTLFMVALLAQHRNSFIVAVALWIGVCTAAAARFRGFQAYGWLLAGYTTCLVGFPAFMDATHAFDIAVDRVTIVSVGILSAGVVSAVLLPTRSSVTLLQLVRGSFTDFVAFVDAATRAGGGSALRTTQQRFSRDLASLEAARASSVFEDPLSRIRSGRLLGFIACFMSVSSRLHLLHRQLEGLDAHGLSSVRRALEPAFDAFRCSVRVTGTGDAPGTALEAAPLVPQLEALLQRLPHITDQAAAALGALDPAMRAAWSSTGTLLREAVEEAHTLAAVYSDMHSLRGGVLRLPVVRPSVTADWLQATVGGLRAALVVVTACAFWISSGWPEGFSLTLLSAVGCALLASAPQPTVAAVQMSKGFLCGFPALVICYSWVLPAANGFGMLALALVPFLSVGAWLMTRPGKALVGGGYFLMFLTGLNLSGLMSYDFIGFINNAIALLFGMATAALSLTVLVPADPHWRYRRTQRALVRSLHMARDRPLPQLRARFESRVRELTIQLMSLQPAPSQVDDAALGFIVVEAGDAIIRLRSLRGQFEALPAAVTSECIDAVIQAIATRDVVSIDALAARIDALQKQAQVQFADASLGVPARATVAQYLVAWRTLRVALEDLDAALEQGARGAALHAA